MPSPLDELGEPLAQDELDSLGDPLDSLGVPVDAPSYGQPQSSVRLNITPDAELTPGPVSTFEADGQVPEFLRYQPPLPTKVPGRQEQNKRAYAAGNRRRTSSEPAFEAGPLRVYPTSGPQTGPLTAQRGNALDFDAELDLHALDIPATLDWNSGALFSGATDAAMLGQADAVAGAIGGPEVMQNVQRYSQMARENNPGSYTLGAIGGSIPAMALGPTAGANTAGRRILQMGALGAGVSGVGQTTRNIVANRPLTQDVAGEALTGMALMGGAQVAGEALAGSGNAARRLAGYREQVAARNMAAEIPEAERAAMRSRIESDIPLPEPVQPSLREVPEEMDYLRLEYPGQADMPQEPIPLRPRPQEPVLPDIGPEPVRMPARPRVEIPPAPAGQLRQEYRRLLRHNLEIQNVGRPQEAGLVADVADEMFPGQMSQAERFDTAASMRPVLDREYAALNAAYGNTPINVSSVIARAAQDAADVSLSSEVRNEAKKLVDAFNGNRSPTFAQVQGIKRDVGYRYWDDLREAQMASLGEQGANALSRVDTRFRVSREVLNQGSGASQFVAQERAVESARSREAAALEDYERRLADARSHEERNALKHRMQQMMREFRSADRSARVENSSIRQRNAQMASEQAELESSYEAAQREVNRQVEGFNADRQSIISSNERAASQAERETEALMRERERAVQERLDSEIREMVRSSNLQNRADTIGVTEVVRDAWKRKVNGVKFIEWMLERPGRLARYLPNDVVAALEEANRRGMIGAALYQYNRSSPELRHIMEVANEEE